MRFLAVLLLVACAVGAPEKKPVAMVIGRKSSSSTPVVFSKRSLRYSSSSAVWLRSDSTVSCMPCSERQAS